MNRLSGKTSVGLDNDELVHLALYAMRNDRHDEAMSLLKRAIEASPDSAAAHYLSDYTEVAGIMVPTKHRIYPRAADGQKVPEPLLVAIDLSEIAFT